MIYRLLPVWEVFSAYRGTAIPVSVASIMRCDPTTVVVCQSADSTWAFDPKRILVISGLHSYAKIRAGKLLPIWIARLILRRIFRPLLSRLKPGDIVWCHNDSALAAALASSIHLTGARLIYQFHDANVIRGMPSHFRSFTPEIYFFVSEATRQQWLRRLPWLKNTFVLYNGADETVFYPSSSKDKQNRAILTVLYVGRLAPEKGVHVLAKAMKILQTRKVDVICKVVGSSKAGGSKQTRYVRSLLKISPFNMRFIPHLLATEIAQEYRGADILCCPSICQEAFGKANIEAMACSIPVVATRVGGIPEIAAEGGLLLVNPNSAQELADSLQSLIEDKDLRKKLGREGFASFRRRFTWEINVKRYNEIINDVVIRKSI